MGDDFTFKLNITVEHLWTLLGREDREKSHTKVLVLDERGSSLRLIGRSVRRGGGPRLDSLTKSTFWSC